MKKLNLFIIKSFIGPFIFTFLIAIFLLLMQFLWKYIDDLVGKGLDFLTISKLLFYAAARFVPMALPISVLLSSIMTFGNIAEKNELMAIKSAGISLKKCMKPLLVFIIIIIQMIRVAAFLVLGLWLVLQFFSIPGSIDIDGGTAYFAHIGGFLAGMILIPFFKNKDIKLFHEQNTSSWRVFNRDSKEFTFQRKDDVVIDFIKKSEEEINRRKH